MAAGKITFKLVAPPQEWVANGVQGICIGQCVVAALSGNFGRGSGLAWDGQAHAHNRLFHDPEHNYPDENFGWICVQPFESKKHGAQVLSLLGEIVLLSETKVPTLVKPGLLAFHEYAHILCPREVAIENREGGGHGPMWRQTITDLGYPEEARRYLLTIHTRKGLAAAHGFRPGQIVQVKKDPLITPKYLQGQKATILHVASRYLKLDFFDIQTKMNLLPFPWVERIT